MNRLTITAMGFLAIACNINPIAPPGGETGGPEGEPEGSAPPNWHCKERAAGANLGSSGIIDGETEGDEVDYGDPLHEKCYFSPAAHGWSYKPHWGGTPDVIEPWLENVDDEDIYVYGDLPGHPVFTWVNLAHPENEDDLPYDVPMFMRDSARSELRSGLGFNFAFWIGGLPNIRTGHRPPIVHATFGDVTETNLPTMLGHPYLSGRYNAGGMFCQNTALPPAPRTNPPADWATLLADYDIHLQVGNSPECSSILEFYGVNGASPIYPLHGGSPMDIYNVTNRNRAIEVAKCLDNGGFSDFRFAAISAGERSGLVWLNWDELAAFQEYVLLHLEPLDLVTDALSVFLDAFFSGNAQEYFYWPENPEYPYQSWAWTGVCSHPVYFTATAADQGFNHPNVIDPPNYPPIYVWTHAGCPLGMMAVIDDLTADDADELAWQADEGGYAMQVGYCTWPLIINAPPPNAAVPTQTPGWSSGKEGSGFPPVFKFFDLNTIDDRTLMSWSRGVSIVPHKQGLQLNAVDATGRALMAAADVPSGSVLMSIGDTIVTRETTVLDAAVLVRAEMETGTVRAVFATPDGGMRHRYVMPYGGSTPFDDVYERANAAWPRALTRF